MPTDLRALAGPSPHSLADISDKVNTGQGHRIVSDAFEGSLSLQIKRFPVHHRTTSSDYFERPDRQGITWSIQVQGSLPPSFSSSTPGSTRRSFKPSFRQIPSAALSRRRIVWKYIRTSAYSAMGLECCIPVHEVRMMPLARSRSEP